MSTPVTPAVHYTLSSFILFFPPGAYKQTNKEPLYGTPGVIVAAFAFFFLVPLPFSVKCTFELQPRHGAQVYTSQAGLIKDVSFRPGDHVQAGDELMRLQNMDLKLELLDLEGRYEQAKQAVASLRLQRFDDPAAIDQIDVALEVQESARKQYEEKKREFEKLTIKAPAAGTIIP